MLTRDLDFFLLSFAGDLVLRVLGFLIWEIVRVESDKLSLDAVFLRGCTALCFISINFNFLTKFNFLRYTQVKNNQ